jgi:hypothetical protein
MGAEYIEVRDFKKKIIVIEEVQLAYPAIKVERDVEGAKFKHRIAEVHATGMKRPSKIVSDLKRLDLLSVQGNPDLIGKMSELDKDRTGSYTLQINPTTRFRLQLRHR